MALGALTKLDLGVLIAFVTLIIMIARNNNKRLGEKADKAALEKLEKDNEAEHIKIERNLSKEMDLKMESIAKVNDEIMKSLTYIRERLDMHIDGSNRVQVRYRSVKKKNK